MRVVAGPPRASVVAVVVGLFVISAVSYCVHDNVVALRFDEIAYLERRSDVSGILKFSNIKKKNDVHLYTLRTGITTRAMFPNL